MAAVNFCRNSLEDGSVEIEIFLYKSMTTATLFGIIASTPARQTSPQGDVQEADQNRMSDSQPGNERSLPATTFREPYQLSDKSIRPSVTLLPDSSNNSSWENVCPASQYRDRAIHGRLKSSASVERRI